MLVTKSKLNKNAQNFLSEFGLKNVRVIRVKNILVFRYIQGCQLCWDKKKLNTIFCKLLVGL